MKKLLLILIIIYPMINYGMDRDKIKHRFSVGPGATGALSSAGLKPGGTMHFDFIIKKKLSAGLKYILVPDLTPNAEVDGLPTKYKGHDFNVSLNTKYYFSGDYQNSKFGFYGTFGAGYWNHTATSYTIYTDNKSRENSYVTKGLMTSLALGVDTKMGIGRLYIDGTGITNIKGKEYTRIHDTATPRSNSEIIKPMSFKLITTGFVCLGYSIMF